MKLCPVCKSVSSDMDMTCGVCGQDLTRIRYESRDEVEQGLSAAAGAEENLERELTRRIRRRMILRTVVGSLLGIGFILGGIIMIDQSQSAQVGKLAGVVLVLLGIFSILMVMNWSLARSRSWIR